MILKLNITKVPAPYKYIGNFPKFSHPTFFYSERASLWKWYYCFPLLEQVMNLHYFMSWTCLCWLHTHKYLNPPSSNQKVLFSIHTSEYSCISTVHPDSTTSSWLIFKHYQACCLHTQSCHNLKASGSLGIRYRLENLLRYSLLQELLEIQYLSYFIDHKLITERPHDSALWQRWKSKSFWVLLKYIPPCICTG